MTIHAYIDYDEATGKYRGVRLKTMKDTHEWASGQPIRDWYQMMMFARTIEDVLMLSSSLTHFLFDVPGYRTVERPEGEFIVWDEKDGTPSPRDADWTNGIVNGWEITGIESDGWPKGWKRGNRYAWCVVAQPTGKPRGIYWCTADLDVIFENHAYHDTQEQAFSRN